MRAPLSVEQAVGFVDGWLAQPYVALIGPGDGHWSVLKNLLLAAGAAGNLTSDAHLAALAIEHGCEVASADNNFRRFSGVTLVNPLASQ
jgi:toxin-antitoxin system PIN domain toxin